MSPKTIVLITGANNGVGFSTAKALAASSFDYHIILGSRSLPKGHAALSSIQSTSPLKGTLSVVQLDVTDLSSIEAAAKAVELQFDRLDILINNAGIVSRAPNLEQKWREDFRTNTLGPVLVTEAFKHLLLKSDHGRLIFVTSELGSISNRLNDSAPSHAVKVDSYRASKAALNMTMAGYHMELGQETGSVKVHAVCPGLVATNLRGGSQPHGTESPDISGRTILGIIEGKRDDVIARAIHKDGVYEW